MRIFVIKDESISETKILGYLIYYETPKAFYIELPPDADIWETPLLLSSFVKRGEHSVGSYWSRIWVQQRIIPQDRQNIGQVLKENGLKEYDEFALLMLANGRCEQDSCYLEELVGGDIPALLQERWQTKVEDVVPLENNRLLTFFRNGNVRIVDCTQVAGRDSSVVAHLKNKERFDRIEVQPDGYGVMWSETATISDKVLYEAGEIVPLSLDDFCGFVRNRVISATQACDLLGCSRQNIDDLVRRHKLHPIRADAKYKLFLKSEVMQRRKN